MNNNMKKINKDNPQDILFELVNHDQTIKRFVYRPTTYVYSTIKSMVINSKIFCPFGQRFSFSFISYKRRIASISSLFFVTNPTTILFTIISFIINSINTQTFFKRRKHIPLKFFKTFPFTFYSFTAVNIVKRIILILTSLFDCTINSVKFTIRKAVSNMPNISLNELSFIISHSSKLT
jgi:hypothetical protein